jgi:Fe-S oxidoreductase/nitrate reductase gamma subunit
MEPYRQVFWNIHYSYIFYSLAAVATFIFAVGLYRRWMLYRSGWSEHRDGGFNWAEVVRRVFINASIFKGDVLGGTTHMLIMWGFVLLFIGTVLSTIDHWLFHYLKGDLYLVYAQVLDWAGAALIAGIVLAYARRWLFKRAKMITVARDHVVLVLLVAIAITGFMVEGFRLRADPPPWHEPSPFGQWVAAASGLSVSRALLAHKVWWWIHSLASLFFIAYFPFSKFIHVFAAPVNVTLDAMGFDSFLTLEEREGLGSDFSFRHLIMLDSCTQCNRCQIVCPSTIAHETLSPREIVDETGSFVRRKSGFGLVRTRVDPAAFPKAKAVEGERVWLCTTCGHCAEECPNAISPMDLIRELRAARVEGGEDVPTNIQEMLESVYKFKNPWQGAKGKRMDWASGLELPVLAEGAAETRCFYVGCTFAYDARLHEVPRSAVRIFRAAGYPFAVLGKDEACCSEFVRGVGEDGLFTELAGENIDAFAKYGITEIVTGCPHGLHTFRNHHWRMEAAARGRAVYHVSQVLEKLLAGGAIRLDNVGERTVTYHDPCFLGRHNGVYDAPRNVITSIPGVRLVEMERSRERSYCCGGGGGRMWIEVGEGEKIAEVRVREAAATGAEIIVTACPFCFSNLDDAVKTAGFEGRLVVKDLTELVAEALPGRAGDAPTG